MSYRGFDSDFLAKLKDKNDIVTVISKYLTLTRRGHNYWCCCPFHGEKTPSFTVKEDGQFYKCFGCGESGDVITFLMKFENIDFMTAVEMLAKNAGMELPKYHGDEEVANKKKLRDRLYLALKDATEFYMNNLKLNVAKPYLEYIQNRGISADMMQKFKIGASLDYDSLPRYMSKKGYSMDELMQAGLVGRNDRGIYYDFYAKRVTFPIFNNFSDVIGFSAREIQGNKEIAKYKNTPQTMLFSKGQTLYAYNFVKEEKKRGNLKEIIIVEGQMDTIACHDAGFVNTIGCMGTALTPNHARELQRLTDNVIVCLDADGAGANATYKAIECLKDVGMNLKVVRLDGAKDPDEFIKKFGKSAFQIALDKAQPFMDFILNDIASKYDLKKNDELNKYVNEALKYIGKLLSPTEQEIYLNVVHEKSRIPKDILRRTLTGSPTEVKKVEAEDKENSMSSKMLAKICLLSNFLYGKFELTEEYDKYFDDETTKEILNYLRTKKQAGLLTPSAVFDDFEVEKDSVLDNVLNFKFSLDENVNSAYLKGCINTLETSYLKDEKKRLLNELLVTITSDERAKILEKLQEIDKNLNKL